MCKRKKTGLLLLAAITVLLSWAGLGLNGKAEAATFSDPLSWSGWEIVDGDNYTHTLENLSLPGSSIDNATLTLEYGGISKCEVWVVQSGNNISIGKLPPLPSNSSNTTTEHTFDLSAILTEMMGTNPWSLTVFFDYDESSKGNKWMKSSKGNKWMKLYKSTLSGEYAPVPIPGSALLLGSGVLCLVVIGRRRRTKKE